MDDVESDLGWEAFWEMFEDVTEGDAEADGSDDTLTASGRPALSAAEKRALVLSAQSRLTNRPGFVAEVLDTERFDRVQPPQPAPREISEQEDVWKLRAQREKRIVQEEADFYWISKQVASWHPDNLNITDLNDQRTRARLRGNEKLDWTEADIWNLITNHGQNVDPWVVRDSPTYLEQNPEAVWDWASQGITYVEETEDWLAEEGHWMGDTDDVMLTEGEFDDGAVDVSGELSGADADAAMASLSDNNNDDES